MTSEEQSRVYEQFEEEMDVGTSSSKESFLDSIRDFTLNDVPPSQWRDKILTFHS